MNRKGRISEAKGAKALAVSAKALGRKEKKKYKSDAIYRIRALVGDAGLQLMTRLQDVCG